MSEDNKKCFFTYDELKGKFYDKISAILTTKSGDAKIPYELSVYNKRTIPFTLIEALSDSEANKKKEILESIDTNRSIPFIHVEFHSDFKAFKKEILDVVPELSSKQIKITTSDDFNSD